MPTELDTGLPSVRFIQELVRHGTSIELQLTTNEKLTGKIRWQDPQVICLVDASETNILIWRQTIAYLKPLG